eukprot:GHVS01012778.1.p1 GENE.GHVS01012778.1~~GHVS01012778.1.p1  ORF type:complete len:547 (-),score=154.41 GHVS01012778.1:171-1811(-)
MMADSSFLFSPPPVIDASSSSILSSSPSTTLKPPTSSSSIRFSLPPASSSSFSPLRQPQTRRTSSSSSSSRRSSSIATTSGPGGLPPPHRHNQRYILHRPSRPPLVRSSNRWRLRALAAAVQLLLTLVAIVFSFITVLFVGDAAAHTGGGGGGGMFAPPEAFAPSSRPSRMYWWLTIELTVLAVVQCYSSLFTIFYSTRALHSCRVKDVQRSSTVSRTMGSCAVGLSIGQASSVFKISTYFCQFKSTEYFAADAAAISSSLHICSYAGPYVYANLVISICASLSLLFFAFGYDEFYFIYYYLLGVLTSACGVLLLVVAVQATVQRIYLFQQFDELQQQDGGGGGGDGDDGVFTTDVSQQVDSLFTSYTGLSYAQGFFNIFSSLFSFYVILSKSQLANLVNVIILFVMLVVAFITTLCTSVCYNLLYFFCNYSNYPVYQTEATSFFSNDICADKAGMFLMGATMVASFFLSVCLFFVALSGFFFLLPKAWSLTLVTSANIQDSEEKHLAAEQQRKSDYGGGEDEERGGGEEDGGGEEEDGGLSQRRR